METMVVTTRTCRRSGAAAPRSAAEHHHGSGRHLGVTSLMPACAQGMEWLPAMRRAYSLRDDSISAMPAHNIRDVERLSGRLSRASLIKTEDRARLVNDARQRPQSGAIGIYGLAAFMQSGGRPGRQRGYIPRGDFPRGLSLNEFRDSIKDAAARMSIYTQ